MKLTKYIISITLFLLIGFVLYAQPLPPTTPQGRPVPIGNLLPLFFLGASVIGIRMLSRKKE